MQHHGIAAGHHVVAGHSADDDEVQRRLLLELVTDPPADGDTIAGLAASLGPSREDIERAARALDTCGLADRYGQTVRPSQAARRFDELWPTV